jgi:4-alpha-glucanotransferase
LRSLGIAGFKIPQWEMRDGTIIPGEMYERLSVATYATHDHSPIRALWNEAFAHPSSNTGAQARDTLEKIALFAGLRSKIDALDFKKDFYPAIMEALFKCNSWIAIVMITDLLARKYRFNVPGTKANLNWTRRMQRSIEQLSGSPRERKRMQLIRELLEKTGRI